MSPVTLKQHFIRKVHLIPEIRILVCAFDLLDLWQFENLSAPFWRIYWNENLGGKMRWNGCWIPMVPQEVYLIAPNTPYQSTNEGAIHHFYLHFITAEPFMSIHNQIFTFPFQGDLARLIEELSRSLRGEEISEVIFSLHAVTLAHLALSLLPPDKIRPVSIPDRLRRVLEFMEVRLNRRVSNSELAKIAGMHPNAFTRLFRKVIGYSPQHYLNRKRIEQACIMLHNINVNIEEVAEALGFCDRYHFSRVFKQIRGVGPATFQKTLILGEPFSDEEDGGG